MKKLRSVHTLLMLIMIFLAFESQAQQANDTEIQQAILQALPDNLTPETATADDLALSAIEVAFSMEGDRYANLTQVMVSLGELERAGTFKNAPRFGSKTPTGRLYTRVLNLASSALDVTYETYHGVTVQHIIALTAAMWDGMNFLNGAKSNAITRN